MVDSTHSSSSSLGSSIRRKTKDKVAGKFSPSYGVHKGLIRDPNWPPAEFPEGGMAMSRRNRRVATKFNVLVNNEWVEVKGDLSKGGALFILPTKMDQKYAHIHFGSCVARVEILSSGPRNKMIGHHCRFIDAKEAQALWEEVRET